MGSASARLRARCAARAHWRALAAALSAVAALAMLAVPAAAAEASARAAEVRLVVDDVGPFAFRDGGQVRGVSYELLRAMAARVGHSGSVALMPLARELELVKRERDVIGTLVRGKEREASYTWIVKLFDEQLVLVTMADAAVDASTLDKARQLRVGLIRGGPSDTFAASAGFLHVDPAASAENNANKLVAGRVDAWLTTWGVAAHAMQRIGMAPARLRHGDVVQRIPMYLAGARDMDRAEAERWRAALAAMKQDGSYQRILRAYNYSSGDAD